MIGLKSERMNDKGVVAPHKAIFMKVSDTSAMDTCEVLALTLWYLLKPRFSNAL